MDTLSNNDATAETTGSNIMAETLRQIGRELGERIMREVAESLEEN